MNENLSVEDIENWIIKKCAEIKEIDPDKIQSDKPFSKYGLDSLEIAQIAGELEEWLKIRVNPIILFEYTTIEKLSNYLILEVNKQNV